MIKLIATDMDGTMLDSNKQFDIKFFSLLKKMNDLGIIFVVASGNQYYRLYQKFLPISDQLYYVAENGSYVANGTREIYVDVISKESVAFIIDFISKTKDIFPVVCGKKGAYVLKDYFHYQDVVKTYYCAYSFINSYDEIDDDILKVAVYSEKGDVNTLFNNVIDTIPSDVRLVTSGHGWMDFLKKDADKGKGLMHLQESLGISRDECVAFGDQMNDYEMFQAVKYSYAMDNAVDALKEIAYEVIGNNDEQSVITTIEQILEEQYGN